MTAATMPSVYVIGLISILVLGASGLPQTKSPATEELSDEKINVKIASFSISDYRRKPTNSQGVTVSSRLQESTPGKTTQDNDRPVLPPSNGPSISKISEPKIPSCAKNGLYCLEDPEYPTNYIQNLINIDVIKKNFLYVPDPAPEIDLSQRIDPTDEQPLCVSKEMLIPPRRLKSLSGQWPFIVNVGNLTQEIRVEVCMQENQPCHLLDSTPQFKTWCKQNFAVRKLMALSDSKEGIPAPEDFKIPSCCSCAISTDLTSIVKRDLAPMTPAPKKRQVRKIRSARARSQNPPERKPKAGPVVVFPDEYERLTNNTPKLARPFNVSLVGANCVDGICDSVPGYPIEYIKRLSELNSIKDMSLFGEDAPPEVDLSTRFDGSAETSLCDSMVVPRFPTAIVKAGQTDPTIIVQDGVKYRQGINTVLCVNAGSKCKFSERLPGYVTECKQKFVRRQLVALSPEGKTYTDFFDIPSCCECQVVSKDVSRKKRLV